MWLIGWYPAAMEFTILKRFYTLSNKFVICWVLLSFARREEVSLSRRMLIYFMWLLCWVTNFFAYSFLLTPGFGELIWGCSEEAIGIVKFFIYNVLRIYHFWGSLMKRIYRSLKVTMSVRDATICLNPTDPKYYKTCEQCQYIDRKSNLAWGRLYFSV